MHFSIAAFAAIVNCYTDIIMQKLIETFPAFTLFYKAEQDSERGQV